MYILSYHLQKKIDADFYAIYDLPNKTRTFFQNQKLVSFKKTWYYNDQINFKKNSFDFDIVAYNLTEANAFFYNGQLIDMEITESQMKSFIEENAQMFSVLVDEYMKKLKTSLLSK